MEQLKFSVSSLLDLSTSGFVGTMEVKHPNSDDSPQDLSAKLDGSSENYSSDLIKMNHDGNSPRYWQDSTFNRLIPLLGIPQVPADPVYPCLGDFINQGIAMLLESGQKYPFNQYSHLLFNPSFTTGYPNNVQHTQRVRGPACLRRAVFSEVQRQGLEFTFCRQAYITKPERKSLADSLGLKDNQVKIWFQNRRMKWRNARANASHVIHHEKPVQQTVNHFNNREQPALLVGNYRKEEAFNTSTSTSGDHHCHLFKSDHPENASITTTVGVVQDNQRHFSSTKANMLAITFDSPHFR